MPQSHSARYTEHCRPSIGKRLHAMRMDKVYHCGQGASLFYRGEDGREVEVCDFVGGFGAALFGHNHPELVARAQRTLAEGLPFNSQGSARPEAAKVGARLGEMLARRTGRRYLTTLANSGAEAVEGAIKHAILVWNNRLRALVRDLRADGVRISRRRDLARVAVGGRLREVVGAPQLPAELSEHPPTAVLELRTLVHRPEADDDARGGALAEALERLDAVNRGTLEGLGKPVFLALERAFHGKTSGAVQLTHSDEYREPFVGFGIEAAFVPCGDVAALHEAVAGRTSTLYRPVVRAGAEGDELSVEEIPLVHIAGFFVEPIQGEGGIHVVPKAYLERCREEATAGGFPLVFDEIQTGMGRTGTFLFSEQQGVVADYYLLSKSLGGGMAKVSALLMDAAQYDERFGRIHTSTFAEDCHSAALAVTALNLLERDDEVYASCQRIGASLIERLEAIRSEFPGVIEQVRGRGLMIGLELCSQTESSCTTLRALGQQHLFGYVVAGYLLHEHRLRVFPTLSNSDTLRLEPSYRITEDDCDRLAEGIRRLCEAIEKQNTHELLKFIAGLESPDDPQGIADRRRPAPPPPPPRAARRVAFLGHFIHPRDLIDFDPGLEGFSEEQLGSLLDRFKDLVDPFLMPAIPIRSASGALVDFQLIALFESSATIGAHMRARNRHFLDDKIDIAVELAKSTGCQVMGYGGFTSIITNNCLDVKNTGPLALTSGNSLTVAMGFEALVRTAEEEGIEFAAGSAAVIGALGNIGSVYGELLARRVPRLLLVGRPAHRRRLRAVAARIYETALDTLRASDAAERTALGGIAGALWRSETVGGLLNGSEQVEDVGPWLFAELERTLGREAPVRVSGDLSDLTDANLIVSTTNDPAPILFPSMLGEGPVVICDISVPTDTDPSVRTERPDVTVILGGVVRLPCNEDFRIPGVSVATGETYACVSESMLMGLEGIDEHYSFGSISIERVEAIMEVAESHGFALGRIKDAPSY
ncbi:MAG: aminotransferase class III-fold pyridoxal phosphate-dependent enzyme [Planctomycetota bacterium]|nr:aminotransferase class III-fold pyridoxal phosphate-dependent enzyme [Planctomycetota bacterium]